MATNFRFPRVFSAATSRRLTLSFGLFVLLGLFAGLADEVQDQNTLGFDVAVLQVINSKTSPLLDTIVVILTQLGGFIAISVLTFGMACLLWMRGYRVKSLFLALAVAGAIVVNTVLKAVYARERPDLWERLVIENSHSFPSGHAMASSALALAVVVLCWRTRFRWLVCIVAVAYTSTIGFTRLYLGVHYPTDIIAGWILSATWVGLLAYVTVAQSRRVP